METVNLSKTQDAPEFSYLELLAYLGMTRHLGGWEATNELTRLCHIGKEKIYLDVGCGIGKAACARARQTGCQVVGIDLSSRMVVWAKERFEDERFDAVITESVLSFVPDKPLALREFMRVTKPGGYIGLNESCWVKTPVPEEAAAFLSRDLFMGAKLETVDYYPNLLEASGLKDIRATKYTMTARADVLDRAKWFGVRGILTNLYNIVTFSLSSPAHRKTIRWILSMQRQVPPGFYDYYGYGIFAGRK